MSSSPPNPYHARHRPPRRGSRIVSSLRRVLNVERAGLLAIALAFVALHAAAPLPALQGDGYYTYLWARSLAFDGDMDLGNDYALCGDPWGMANHSEGAGPRNQWSPGPAVLWTPMLVVGRLFHPASLSDDPRVAGACQGPLTAFGLFGTVLGGLLTLLLVFRLTRRYVGVGPALLATAGIAFASPLTYYGAWLLSYGHAPAAFAVALFLERWDGTRRGAQARHPLRWVLVGALLGLAMLMRPQNAVFVFGPLGEWLALTFMDLRERRRASALTMVGVGLLFTAGLALTFAPQLAAWKLSYGTYIAMPQGPHYMRWGQANLDGVLFASTGGLLTWTPLLGVGLVGLVLFSVRASSPSRAGRSVRPVAVASLVAFALTVYVNGAVWDYWGSMGFSNRRFTEMSAPLGLGLALVLEGVFRYAERRPRALAGALLGVAVAVFAAWNVAAMNGVATGRIASWRESRSDLIWEQVFHELAHGTYTAVGNPLAWPASLPFAARFDTHPMRYDAMRGMTLYYGEYDTGAPRHGETTAFFTGGPLHALYAADGFAEEPEEVAGRRGLRTLDEDARLLLPVFMEGVGGARVRCRLAEAGHGSLRLTWNGSDLGERDVDARWRLLTFPVPPDVAQAGVNEVELHVEGGALLLSSVDLVAPTAPPVPEELP
ncbi:MAG: hypothetical protein R3B40_14020 [Polyangiales bacterium]|nr:hypothetical protein [Myxococcales bacterium]